MKYEQHDVSIYNEAMILDHRIKGLKRLGSGCYCVTFDTKDGNVMKVPLKQRYTEEFDDDSEFASLPIRKMICESIFDRTMWLRTRMGSVITPVSVDPDGFIIQKRLKGLNFYSLKERAHKNGKMDKFYELERRINELVEDAKAYADASQVLKAYQVDSNRSNFMVNKSFQILGWFDPFIPCNIPYSDSEL